MPLGEKPRVIGAITIRFARRSERKAKGEKQGAIRSSINRPFDRNSDAVPRRSAATAVCARQAFRRGPARTRKGTRGYGKLLRVNQGHRHPEVRAPTHKRPKTGGRIP